MFAAINSFLTRALTNLTDVYWPFVSMLLHGDSPQQFNQDTSTNIFPITANGAVQATTFSPLEAGYYGNSFDGSGYLTAPASANAQFSFAGNFTIEMWALATGPNANGGIAIVGGNGTFSWYVGYNGTSGFTVYDGSTTITSSVTTAPQNTWVHLAICRIGTAVTLYYNGVSVGTGTSSAFTFNSQVFNIGRRPSLNFTGYVSNLRIVNGTALYTGTFTPSTTPLTAVTNTSFLTCQSNNFIDNSTNATALTAMFGPTVVSSNPFVLPSTYSSYGSGYFDGGASAPSLSVPANAAFNLGTSNFTIEYWIYLTATTGNYLNSQSDFAITSLAWYQNCSATGVLISVVRNSSNTDITCTSSTGAIVANTWYHVAFVRDGNTTRQYINGVQNGTGNVTGFTVRTSTGTLNVGNLYVGSTGDVKGYISNFRLVNGTCLYPSGTTFTPPTTPLTAVTNTALLTLQTNVPQNNNQFFDTSTNNFTVTRNGNTTQGSFNPFVSTYPYAVATNGGSAYFDGTGDYLTVPDNAAFTLGTNDFTIECWIYPATSGSTQYISGQCSSAGASPSFALAMLSTGRIQGSVYAGGSVYNIQGTTVCSINTWAHVAFVRNGNAFRLYVNGVQENTATYSITLQDSPHLFGVGSNGAFTTFTWNGYISNFRLVNGTCLYPSGTTFTPPTAPLTAVTNTALLLGMSNGAIYDNAELNNLETVANAQISTSVFKYGTGALKFNGTTDVALTPAKTAFTLGSGDFTVECWINQTAAQNAYIAGQGDATSTAANTPWYMFINTSSLPQIAVNTSGGLVQAVSSTAVTLNTWTHVAGVRNGSTLRLYVNGVQTATSALIYTVNTSSSNLGIGNAGDSTSYYFNGYIDDFRFTKGICRYPSGTTFTPPTAAFPNKGDTPGPYVVLNQTSIFGFGFSTVCTSITNLVSNTGVVASDTTGVGTVRYALAAAGYGGDKAIFGYGSNAGTFYSMTNLVSNTGVVATDTAGVGQVRMGIAAATYGTDKAIFGYGGRNYPVTAVYSVTNLVSNTGVVATDTTGVGTARLYLAATGYGADKAMFGYGSDVAGATLYSITNLVSNTGVVASDTTGVGTSRANPAATRYGSSGQAIFGYGFGVAFSSLSMTNLVSNTGVVATDTTGVGTARSSPGAAVYGSDKGLFGFGYTTVAVSMTNLISNTGVVATDTTGVGTARYNPGAAGYGA